MLGTSNASLTGVSSRRPGGTEIRNVAATASGTTTSDNVHASEQPIEPPSSRHCSSPSGRHRGLPGGDRCSNYCPVPCGRQSSARRVVCDHTLAAAGGLGLTSPLGQASAWL